ncbi:hypothetical protein EW145_g5274 [Phellinidium pouzarii]|uniref:Protein BFR2 n=1 Tax=Phellinidium pouzarii TaxID=167371 RepID=A0A4S4L0K0_9AGAM|nr:hypothetical protein EW145_g5274 [Phellinidium pouzarii]
MSLKRVSLAQQLAQLDKPAPVDFDPEDAVVVGVDAEDASEQPGNGGREHYLDVGPSALRKLRDSVAAPKYDGVRVSRIQLEDSDAEMSEPVPGSEDRPVTSEEDEKVDKDVEKDDEEDDEEESEHIIARDYPQEPPPMAPSVPLAEDDLSSTLKRTRQEERKKGKAVARQLAMYDSLLDARIRMQKCAVSMNKLPNASKIPDYLLSPNSHLAANKMLSEAMSLADDLFDLRKRLLTSNESINPPARKRRKLSEHVDVDRDWEEELQSNSMYFAELESTFHPHLLSTLQKWSNKVLAIAPSALLPSNRTRFSRSNANQVKSAVQLIDDALLDRNALLARTRVWRGKGDRLGSADGKGVKNKEPSETTSPEAADDDVFDDTDFYQSLLRDVIDARAGSGAGADGLDGLAVDWRASQKQRKTRRASTVDTRASKGRKLRFEVHEKIQNFMAPAPPPSVSGGALWHEAQIDELFAGLLGRGYAAGAEEVEASEQQGSPLMDIDKKQSFKNGFRVFG